jgi:hypothetical protein
MITNEQREELRHAALEFLSIRHPAAFNLRQIHRALNRELGFLVEAADIESALQFLRGLKFTDTTPDELGSTFYWRATSEGVRAYERGAFH